MKDNYYSILGLTPKADEKEIRNAYRNLARRYHPDVNQGSPEAEESFKKIAQAYDTLSDPGKRLVYDMRLLNEVMNPGQAYRQAQRSYRRSQARTYRARHVHREIRQKYPQYVVWIAVIGVFMLGFTVTYSLFSYQKAQNYKMALQAVEEGKYVAALRHLETSSDALGNGLSPQGYLLGAEISMYRLNDYRRAARYTNEGLSADPDPDIRSRLLYLRGKQLMHQHQYRTAYSTFESAYRLNPLSDSSLYALAEMQTLVFENLDKGNELTVTLINRFPDFANAYFLLGYSAYKTSNYPEAINMINRYLKLEPESGTGFFLRARINIKQSQSPVTICNDLQTAKRLNYPVPADIFEEFCS